MTTRIERSLAEQMSGLAEELARPVRSRRVQAAYTPHTRAVSRSSWTAADSRLSARGSTGGFRTEPATWQRRTMFL
ncbi:hypothetical protein AMK68_05215 [candidate division KD3-62 bacterium DG_56]|uniref:Uncharacterized protein n=1 Tax=candidate division KD3-62 bacterium DG_56 TaxID=1704032 RepID=A0A0S7XJ51_9BACT|nr:MAG: hypothetical protein AMK68_05215 [candidate division KD3-62 bacterium DG_56]